MSAAFRLWILGMRKKRRLSRSKRVVSQGSSSSRPAGPPLPTSTERRGFRRRLLTWYRRNGRDLPWRSTRDPYRILVSEVMLQQTQVDRVAPKFVSFMAAFPTLDALAGAEAGDVLAAVMGVSERPSGNEFVKCLGKYMRLVGRNQGESEEAIALRRELESLSPRDPALDRADVEIRRRKLMKEIRKSS